MTRWPVLISSQFAGKPFCGGIGPSVFPRGTTCGSAAISDTISLYRLCRMFGIRPLPVDNNRPTGKGWTSLIKSADLISYRFRLIAGAALVRTSTLGSTYLAPRGLRWSSNPSTMNTLVFSVLIGLVTCLDIDGLLKCERGPRGAPGSAG